MIRSMRQILRPNNMSALITLPILIALILPLSRIAQARYTIDAFYLFGVVNDEGQHFNDLWDRGLRATTFELQWKLYEPQPGVYDLAYINHMKDVLHGLKQQGWMVQMIPGFHYAPDWVYSNYPDVYYINQYGEKYNPDPVTQGDFRIINAPFNPQAQSLIAGYLGRIFQDFDQDDPFLRFDSVRIGGGPQGELRYPPADWNGRTNSYWGFDSYAQNPAFSGIPNQVIGWRPGIDENPGSLNRGQLLVNPGFEDQHTYYSLPGWSPDDEVEASLGSDLTASGSHALQLTIHSTHRIHQFVRVKPNQTYDFGGWVLSGDGIGAARILVTQYDGGTNLIGSAPFGKAESTSSGWSPVTSSLTTLPETVFLKFEMDGDRAGSFLFDDLWLVESGASNQNNRDIEVPLKFYDWYVDSMTRYQNWQISQIRQHYTGQLDVILAGKGVRMNQITDALTNDLRGDGRTEGSRGLYGAADYQRHIEALPSGNITLYMTGIEDPPESEVDDKSPYPGQWSGARWLAHLARTYGFAIWGENSGRNNLPEMELAVKRMQNNSFFGLLWAHESHLYANPNPENYATASDYQRFIENFSRQEHIYLPLISSQP
ncbi:MAG: beta-galactosidase [Anaerolineales bacterium]